VNHKNTNPPKINNGKGITITREEVTFPDVQHKFKMDYNGRDAYLVVTHAYESDSADYSVYATVELGGCEYDFDDWKLDDGFKDRWYESANAMFGGCFMRRTSSLTLPEDFVEMVQTMLTDLDLVIGGAQ
jgi:hypothetical protein